MRILSIDVVSPSISEFLSGVLVGALFTVPFMVMASLHYLPAMTAAMYAAAAMGGVLVNVHGISVRKQGWRAVVLNFCFVLPLMGGVYLCMAYTG